MASPKKLASGFARHSPLKHTITPHGMPVVNRITNYSAAVCYFDAAWTRSERQQFSHVNQVVNGVPVGVAIPSTIWITPNRKAITIWPRRQQMLKYHIQETPMRRVANTIPLAILADRQLPRQSQRGRPAAVTRPSKCPFHCHRRPARLGRLPGQEPAGQDAKSRSAGRPRFMFHAKLLRGTGL